MIEIFHHAGWNDVDRVRSTKILIQLVFRFSTGIEFFLSILYWMLYKKEIHRDSEFLVSVISFKCIPIDHRTISWCGSFNLNESKIPRIPFDQQIRQTSMKVLCLIWGDNLIRLPLDLSDFFCCRYIWMRSKNAPNPRLVVQTDIGTGLNYFIKLIPKTPVKAGSEPDIHRFSFPLDV